jgi:hypothetical protein
MLQAMPHLFSQVSISGYSEIGTKSMQPRRWYTGFGCELKIYTSGNSCPSSRNSKRNGYRQCPEDAGAICIEVWPEQDDLDGRK